MKYLQNYISDHEGAHNSHFIARPNTLMSPNNAQYYQHRLRSLHDKVLISLYKLEQKVKVLRELDHNSGDRSNL